MLISVTIEIFWNSDLHLLESLYVFLNKIKKIIADLFGENMI